jgi:hypothetical protein
MRHLAICCTVVVLAGCGRAEQQAAGDQAAASISLADVAGTWNVRTMAQGSDSVLVSFQMTAGGDTSGWSFNVPQRGPVPVRVVAVAGDSIVTDAGPYESVLRPGVQVSVHSVLRLQDGKLVGTSTARYSSSGADSVVTLRTEGTRAP